MTKKSAKSVYEASRIIAHWREYYGQDETYKIVKNVAEIDKNLAALAIHVGRPLTDDEQGAALDIVDEFMPKDEKGGYYWPLISFEKAWEVYEMRKQVKKLLTKPTSTK